MPLSFVEMEVDRAFKFVHEEKQLPDERFSSDLECSIVAPLAGRQPIIEDNS